MTRPVAEIAQDVANAFNQALYGNRYCSSLSDLAEMELNGRTHYYDASNRRYFGCRLLHVQPLADGLILATVESVSHPSEGRLYRVVCFDMRGTVIHRTGDGTDCHGFKSSKSAYKELAGLKYDTITEARRVIAEEMAVTQGKLDRLGKVSFE